MIHNQNARAALVVTFIAVAGLVVLFVTVFQNPSTNLASEIAKSSGDRSTVVIATGTPILLIPDVTMTITSAEWSNTLLLSKSHWRGSRPFRIDPTSPEFRFLVLEYEIDNSSNDWLTRKGLAEILRVTDGIGPDVAGADVDTIVRPDRDESRKTQIEQLMEVPSDFVHVGRWVFELDAQRENLSLKSDLIGFELPLPSGDFGTGN